MTNGAFRRVPGPVLERQWRQVRCLMHLAAGGAIIWTMTDDKVKRRLTTVLCADAHGYSRLMEADEAGTLGTLRRSRTAIAGLVARHDGRVVTPSADAPTPRLPRFLHATPH